MPHSKIPKFLRARQEWKPHGGPIWMQPGPYADMPERTQINGIPYVREDGVNCSHAYARAMEAGRMFNTKYRETMSNLADSAPCSDHWNDGNDRCVRCGQDLVNNDNSAENNMNDDNLFKALDHLCESVYGRPMMSGQSGIELIHKAADMIPDMAERRKKALERAENYNRRLRAIKALV